MPIDTSIYGMLQQPKALPGPLDRYVQAQQVGSMLDQSETAKLQRQLLQQQVDTAPAKAALEAKLGQLSIAEKQGGIERTAAETFLKNAQSYRDMIAGVRDDNDLAMVRDRGVQLYGPRAAASMPQSVTDPAFAGWQQKSITTADEWLKQQEAQRGRDVTLRGQNLTDARSRETAAETARHNRATESAAAAAAAEAARHHGVLETKEKQPTDTENVASGYASRMRNAAAIMAPLESKGVGTPEFWEVVGGKVPLVGADGRKMLSNAVQSPERQQYRQAQEDWVRAKLRKESGAVIADEEMDREIATYFPRVGDNDVTIKQKAQARKAAEAAMVQAAGRAPLQAPPTPAHQSALAKPGGIKFLGFEGQ